MGATDPAILRERLLAALDLFDVGVSMKRASLRREHPAASDEEIDARLRAWVSTRPGAEHGDAVGRPRPLDRRG